MVREEGKEKRNGGKKEEYKTGCGGKKREKGKEGEKLNLWNEGWERRKKERSERRDGRKGEEENGEERGGG